jgi:hypothetical protein
MTYADFTNAKYISEWPLLIRNVNMTGAIISDDLLINQTLINVLLPNGTWHILDENLIVDGNAAIVCSNTISQL